MSIFSERSAAAIRDRHGYHPATPETAVAHDAVRTACIDLALMLNDLLPNSPEAKNAHERLHEVRMWANAAIAIHGAPAATQGQRRTPQPALGQS